MTTRDMIDNVRQGAQDTMETVTEAASGTRTSLLDLVEKVGQFFANIETPSSDDLLARIGLRRQRSTVLQSAATFGAGFVAGGIAGVLLAPKSGQELRNDIAKRIDDYLNRGREIKSEIAHDIEVARDQIEDVSHQAKDRIQDAAANTKEKVIDAATAAKDIVTDTTHTAKDKVIDAATAAKDKVIETKDKITDTTQAAKEKVVDAATAARDTVKDAMERTKEMAQQSAAKPANGVHR